jgi:hypothetical protein
MNRFINITSKIKNGMIYSFIFGFGLGLIPNDIWIQYNNNIKYHKIPVPLITGCFGISVFLGSPFILSNYFLNGVYLDKLIEKYDIDIKRYHQYDENDNKYAYPSILTIDINSKNIEEITTDKK